MIGFDRYQDIHIWDYRNNQLENQDFHIKFLYNTDISYYDYYHVTCIFANLNNDNLIDLLIINHKHFTLGITFGYWSEYFKKTVKIISTANLCRRLKVVVVEDLNFDNNNDIIIYDCNKTIGVIYGYGNGSFQQQPILSYSRQLWSDFAIEDINNDDIKDIIGIDNGNSYLEIFIGINNGYFITYDLLFTGYNTKPHSIVFSDFNNDNKIDIAVSNSNLNSIGIFTGHGNGSFSFFTIISVLSEKPTFIINVDLNNDNRKDLIVSTAYYATILLNTC